MAPSGKSRSRPASQHIEEPPFQTEDPAVPGPSSSTIPIVPINIPSAVIPLDDLRSILSDNRDALAEMLHSVLTVASTQNSSSSSARHHNPVGRPLKLNMKSPDEFDGQSKHVINFLAEVKAHILADPASFENEQTKIMFLLSFCSKGTARTWKNKMLSDIENGDYPTNSFRNFVAFFKSVFYSTHAEEQAQRELMALRQGNAPAQDFLISFQEVMERSGFCEKSSIFHLKRALNPKLLEEVARYYDSLSSFDEWKAAIIHCDHRIQEVNATIAHQRADMRPFPSSFRSRWPAFPSSSSSQPTSNPNPNPLPSSSAATPPTTPAPHASLPSNISAPPDKFLRQRQSGPPSCFNCGGKGHYARSCSKPFNPEVRKATRTALEKARAVIEEFDALPDEEREDIFRMDCDLDDAPLRDSEDFVIPTE